MKKHGVSRARDDTCIFHMPFCLAFLIVFDDTFCKVQFRVQGHRGAQACKTSRAKVVFRVDESVVFKKK